MENFKKIILALLTACAASSAVFAMDPDLEKKKEQQQKQLGEIRREKHAEWLSQAETAESASSVNFEINDGDFLSAQPDEILNNIFVSLIKKPKRNSEEIEYLRLEQLLDPTIIFDEEKPRFNLNTPEGIYKAIKYIKSFRIHSKRFKTLLSNENIGLILRLADVNIMPQDLEHGTVLHYAANKGDADIIKIIIDAIPEGQRSAFITTQNTSDISDKCTALVVAIDTCLSEGRNNNKHKNVTQVLVNAYKQIGIEIPQDLLPKLRNMGIGIE